MRDAKRSSVSRVIDGDRRFPGEGGGYEAGGEGRADHGRGERHGGERGDEKVKPDHGLAEREALFAVTEPEDEVVTASVFQACQHRVAGEAPGLPGPSRRRTGSPHR